MKYAIIATALLLGILLFTSGCVTTESLQRIDALTASIKDLQAQAEDKMEEARQGTLTTGEALEFARYAQEEVRSAKAELNTIKNKENIGWTEIIGAIAASLLGGTGIVRAWRGPTHKKILPISSSPN